MSIPNRLKKFCAAHVPFAWVRPRLARRLTSLFGHTVNDEPSPLTRNLYRHPSVEQFERALDELAQSFTFVSLSDVWASIRKGCGLPQRALFLSFDDGHREMYEVVAPILERRGIPAAFFVTTAAIDNRFLFWPHRKSYLLSALNCEVEADVTSRSLSEAGRILGLPPGSDENVVRRALAGVPVQKTEDREKFDDLAELFGISWSDVLSRYRPYLSLDQLRQLKDRGFDIGSHGVDHTKFCWLSEEERDLQLGESIDFLCANLGLEKVTFSFPNSAAGLTEDWICRAIARHPRLDGFAATGRYRANDVSIFHRVTMDSAPGVNNEFDVRRMLTAAFIMTH